MESINISIKNIVGKCDLKCAYNFKYLQSNTTVKNNGVNLTLSYDNSSIPPVLYNNQEYQVSNIVINCPSVHNFNGALSEAEISIEHIPVSGGNNLIVCIPIKSSSESSEATTILNEIIDNASVNTPVEGESNNLKLSDFTLQNIVPNKPFFSYVDNNNSDYIVFGFIESIPLSSDYLQTLKQIIKPFPLNMLGGPLFYNASGPNTTGIQNSSGIYISCSPTGQSEEEIPVDFNKNTNSYNFSGLWSNPIFKLIIQFIIGLLLSIIIFSIIGSIYSFITTGAVKLPSIPKFGR